MRIVSLLPAATEIVCALGLRDQLVGVSHECDFPYSVRELPKVTRSLIPTTLSSGDIDTLVRDRVREKQPLYALDLAILDEVQPELIITQALCDVCAVSDAEVRAAACQLPRAPRVLNLEPRSLSDLFTAIADVGAAAGVQKDVTLRASQDLSARVDAVRARTALLARVPRVAFIEWLDPPFSCGHWNPELVRLAGGADALGNDGGPARTIGWDDVVAWNPEIIFIACCGFDTDRTVREIAVLDAARLQNVAAIQNGRVYVADGAQYFSRPGPRLVDSLEILAHAFHPGLHPLPDGLTAAIQCVPVTSAHS